MPVDLLAQTFTLKLAFADCCVRIGNCGLGTGVLVERLVRGLL